MKKQKKHTINIISSHSASTFEKNLGLNEYHMFNFSVVKHLYYLTNEKNFGTTQVYIDIQECKKIK